MAHGQYRLDSPSSVNRRSDSFQSRDRLHDAAVRDMDLHGRCKMAETSIASSRSQVSASYGLGVAAGGSLSCTSEGVIVTASTGLPAASTACTGTVCVVPGSISSASTTATTSST